MATADVKAFRALRYNPEKAGDIAKVVAPPYDIIRAEKRQGYYERSPHNILHCELAPENDGADRYTSAAGTAKKWISEGVLRADEKPAFYVVEQAFETRRGVKKVRRGFLALLRSAPFYSGGVFPHEKTFPSHKEDRLKLLRATGIQFSPIFGVYPDEKDTVGAQLKKAMEQAPEYDFAFEDGSHNRMWTLSDAQAIEDITRQMRDNHIFIADGHHRYETSMNYAREQRESGRGDGPWDYVMILLVSLNDEGLEIFPTHRMLKGVEGFSEAEVLKRLEKNFVIEEKPRADALGALEPGAHRFVLQVGGVFRVMSLRKEADLAAAMPELSPAVRELDVSILHHLAVDPLMTGVKELHEKVVYDVDEDRITKAVASGEAQAAFYLASTPTQSMIDIAMAQDVMPHKTTYFFPKAVTGVAMHRMVEEVPA